MYPNNYSYSDLQRENSNSCRFKSPVLCRLSNEKVLKGSYIQKEAKEMPMHTRGN